MSETKTAEIADGVYRFSTAVSGVGPEPFTFNQFLLMADEPLLFHLGHRQMFPSVSAAVARVTPLASLRYLSFGHVEADECGALNPWLAAAPSAEIVHSRTACMVSLNDLADRAPRALADGETLDLGGRRVGLRVGRGGIWSVRRIFNVPGCLADVRRFGHLDGWRHHHQDLVNELVDALPTFLLQDAAGDADHDEHDRDEREQCGISQRRGTRRATIARKAVPDQHPEMDEPVNAGERLQARREESRFIHQIAEFSQGVFAFKQPLFHLFLLAA